MRFRRRVEGHQAWQRFPRRSRRPPVRSLPTYSLGNASERFIHNDSQARSTAFSPELVDLRSR